MQKAAVEISPAILDSYRNLVADYPDLNLKGVSMPYTSLNGNMVEGDVIALRTAGFTDAAILDINQVE